MGVEKENIDEIKQLQSENESLLLNSEIKYRTLVESAYDSILIIKDELIVFANSKSFEISGYKEEEVINQPFTLFIVPEDIEKVKKSYSEKLRDQVSHFTFRTEILMKDGSRKPVEISATSFDYYGENAVMIIIRDISKQVALEKVHEEELLLLRTLINHLPSSVFVLDKNFRKTVFNDLHLNRVNSNFKDEDILTYDELLGKTNWEIYPKSLADYYFIEDKRVIEEGLTVINREVKGVDLLGKPIWEAISKIPMRDKNGQIIGIVGIANNITKNKLYEFALKESEERLRRAIVYAPIPMIIFTGDKKIHQISEGLINLSGYDLNDTMVISEWIEKAFPEFSGNNINSEKDFKEIINTLLTGEKEIICKDGSSRIWDFTTTLIGLTSNDQHLYLSTAVDLTKRKKAEHDLLKSQKQLESIFYAVDNIIYLLKVEGEGLYRYESMNKTFSDLTGMSVDNIIGKLVTEVVPEPSLSTVLSKYKEAITYKTNVHWEGTVQYPTGEKTGEITVVPVFDENGNCSHLVGSVNDITERKLVEKEIIKLNAILENRVKERTAQLESTNHDLEAFTYSVSHDLRAPLRHIEGLAKLMKKTLPENSSETEKYLIKISESICKMNLMIEALLSFSRLGRKSLQISIVDLNELVRKIIDQFKIEIDNRKVEWRISNLPEIKGDYNLLEFVFLNLISNALKFTSKKEIAKIEIFCVQKSTNHCVVCISDNGVGFDMNYANKLFNVFQRLHAENEFEGTGIGLANVKQIINKHGWTITAEGEEGKGASFYINFIS